MSAQLSTQHGADRYHVEAALVEQCVRNYHAGAHVFVLPIAFRARASAQRSAR